MKITKTKLVLGTLLVAGIVSAAAISVTDRWSWGGTIGWMNWNTTNGTAVDVTDTAITGNVWSQAYGWINLNPTNAGVTNTCAGDVGGYAWGGGIGWIGMQDVSIHPNTGVFYGTATTTGFGDVVFNGTNIGVETLWRCTDPPVDTDTDGYPDFLESLAGSDINASSTVPVDTDGDGHPNIIEELAPSTVTNAASVPTDTDGDGVPDAVEVLNGTDPNDPNDVQYDQDGDGHPDYTELVTSSSPYTSTSVPTTDTDGDGVLDAVELMQSTDPNNIDSNFDTQDGDGHPTYVEVVDGSDPTVTTSVPTDTDDDGVPDVVELTHSTSPTDATDTPSDTDGDGHPDYTEMVDGSDSTVVTDVPVDTDQDGVPDVVEIMEGTDPDDNLSVSTDTDNDGHPDYTEMVAGSNPNSNASVPTDTDNDLVPDVVEIMAGTDPTDATVYPDRDNDTTPTYVETQDGTNGDNASDVDDTDNGGVTDYVETVYIPNVGGTATDINDSSDDGQPVVITQANNGAFIRGTGAAGATVTVTTTDGSLCTATVNPSGEWNCSLSPTPAESVTVTASQVDLLGNNTSDTDTIIYASSPGGSASGGSSGGGTRYVCRDPAALNYRTTGNADNQLCRYPDGYVSINGPATEDVDDNEESVVNEPVNNQTQDTRPPLVGGGEPNVPAEFAPYVCERYLREYIFPGRDNNPEEVRKLQLFLNEQGEDLVVDGFYGDDDIAAVRRFQEEHRQQILFPWGLRTPTANVYRTTVAKINLMTCAKQTQCPYFTQYAQLGDVSLENVRIQDFLNIIFAPTSGYPDNAVPLSRIYTRATHEAVKDYQDVYSATVLDPWGLSQPTGRFYQTSRYSANDLMGCTEPSLQLSNGVRVSY